MSVDYEAMLVVGAKLDLVAQVQTQTKYNEDTGKPYRVDMESERWVLDGTKVEVDLYKYEDWIVNPRDSRPPQYFAAEKWGCDEYAGGKAVSPQEVSSALEYAAEYLQSEFGVTAEVAKGICGVWLVLRAG